MSTTTLVNTLGTSAYSMNPESIPAGRYMGLSISFVPAARAYRVTDVNGISYFGATKDEIRQIMRQHGRKVLKTKVYTPRRVVAPTYVPQWLV